MRKLKFKDLHNALLFLYNLRGKGYNLRLKQIKAFLKFIGNPEKRFKSILITGTNGKGSTATLLFNALKENNIKTALYLSPHLIKFNERIQTSNGMISDKELFNEINFVYFKMLESRIKLSFFEFITALAFHYFARKKTKIAVIEVGLGARFDATNILDSILSVITSIDLEHKQFLGNTLKEITREKAEIIKKHSIVVVGEKRRKLQKLIKEKSIKMKSESFLINNNFKFKKLNSNSFFQDFSFELKLKNKLIKFESVRIKLLGLHQIKNAAIALTTLLLLNEKLYLNLKENKIFKAFKNTKFNGRLQVIKRKPLLLIDVAHNPAGIKALTESLQEIFPKKKFLVVFGCSSDKNYKRMLQLLNPIASSFILSKAEYRSQNSEKLLNALKKINPRIKVILTKNSMQAVKLLIKLKKPTIACGSIFFVGEILEALKKTQKI